MTKSEIEPLVGKFVKIAFTYRARKLTEPKFVEAYGHIIRLEDKNLLFKDNDNFEYIVPLNKIWYLSSEGKRRTVREHQNMLLKKLKLQSNEKLSVR